MGKNPERLLDNPPADYAEFNSMMMGMFRGYRSTILLLAAYRKGLFEKLQNPATSEELADAVGWHGELCRMVLDALVPVGFVSFDGEKYSLSDNGRTYLLRDSDFTYTHRLDAFCDSLLPWLDLEDLLVDGPIEIERTEMFSTNWIQAMGDMRRLDGIRKVIDSIARNVPLDTIKDVMEIGAGHAYHLIALMHTYPHLSGYVFDRPGILETTDENLRLYGKSATLLGGDFYEQEIPGTYDLVISQLNPAGSDVVMCEKVAAIVRKGGYLFIRRHYGEPEADPLVNIDRGIRGWIGIDRTKIGGWGDTRNANAGYDEKMISLGMELVVREECPANVENVIFRKL